MTLDGTQVPQFDVSIAYSELDIRSAEVDHTVAKIARRIKMRIEALSSGPGAA